MELGKVGVWWSGSWRGDPGAGDIASELESLGFGALWSSGRFEAGVAGHFERILVQTTKVVVASGIISIWPNEPGRLANAVDDLDSRYPGRFLLGLGASHSAVVPEYSRPYGRMIEFLDGLDGLVASRPGCGSVGPFGKESRVLAALGPRMLSLAASRAAGAHPYFVPAEHTERARRTLGPGPLLAPEVTVVLEENAAKARDLARTFTAGYLALDNYNRNLRSLGFGDEELADGGSDRLVDAVVCWGDPATVASKVRSHLDAGADHVCLQVVTSSPSSFPMAQYRDLAGALDL